MKIWKLEGLEEVFRRRFLLIHQAVEVYTHDQKAYFFNFFNPNTCQAFLDRLSEVQK